MDDVGAALEKILGNPDFARLVKDLGGTDNGDLVNRLPEVMEALGPLLGGSAGTEAKGVEIPTADDGEGAKEAALGDGGGENGLSPPQTVIGRRPFNRADAEKLFLALRPYLGDRRRDLVDRCMSVMKMGDLLKAAGLMSPASGRRSGEA